MTDTPESQPREMVVALTPQQLIAIVAAVLVIVLIRRARKRRPSG